MISLGKELAKVGAASPTLTLTAKRIVEPDQPKPSAYAERLIERKTARQHRRQVDAEAKPRQSYKRKSEHKERAYQDKRRAERVPKEFRKPALVDEYTLAMTDGSRGMDEDRHSVGAAASYGKAVARELKKAKVPRRTAKFYGSLLGWRKLQGKDVRTGAEAPEYEGEGRAVKLKPVADRHGETITKSEAKAELKRIIKTAVDQQERRTRRWTEVKDGRLLSMEEDLPPVRPATIGEFVEHFPQYTDAVARLLRKL